MYKNYLKRVFDFVLSAIIIIVVSPLFLIVAILLFIANKGQAFFLQERPGKDEKIFKVIKFKTMNDKRGENGELLSDAERLTSVGKFVRKTSLDEIPQLLNVLKGDMSLIGPRPLLVQYLQYYNAEQKRRHNIRPGITGWAQVNGRNAISWEKKFELDVYYVDNLSFVFDLKIMLLTIKKVLISDGISFNEEVSDTFFRGSN